jgi:hypothetical protein
MTRRELTYTVPFDRLTKLSRSAGRKAYPTVWLLTWLWLALFLGTLLGLAVYGDNLRDGLDTVGIPAGVEGLFILLAVLFFVGLLALRRLRVRSLKARANFNQTIRLVHDDGGLRFVTDGVEHYLKWPGISQMFVERDGVVVSHGNLFFLIPNLAFADGDERLGFVRDVYGRLSETARALSERHVRAVLRHGSPKTDA